MSKCHDVSWWGGDVWFSCFCKTPALRVMWISAFTSSQAASSAPLLHRCQKLWCERHPRGLKLKKRLQKILHIFSSEPLWFSFCWWWHFCFVCLFYFFIFFFFLRHRCFSGTANPWRPVLVTLMVLDLSVLDPERHKSLPRDCLTPCRAGSARVLAVRQSHAILCRLCLYFCCCCCHYYNCYCINT